MNTRSSKVGRPSSATPTPYLVATFLVHGLDLVDHAGGNVARPLRRRMGYLFAGADSAIILVRLDGVEVVELFGRRDFFTFSGSTWSKRPGRPSPSRSGRSALRSSPDPGIRTQRANLTADVDGRLVRESPKASPASPPRGWCLLGP